MQLIEAQDGTLSISNMPKFGNSFKQFAQAFGKVTSNANRIAQQYVDKQHNINAKRAVLFSNDYFETKLNSMIADVLKNSGKFKVTKRLVNGGTRFELVKI